MNNYRTLENIIRDVVAKRSPVEERFSLMGAIRNVGSKKPTESPLAQEPVDVTVAPNADVKPPEMPKEPITMKQMIDTTSHVHAAAKQYVRRSQRKLHIIDNP